MQYTCLKHQNNFPYICNGKNCPVYTADLSTPASPRSQGRWPWLRIPIQYATCLSPNRKLTLLGCDVKHVITEFLVAAHAVCIRHHGKYSGIKALVFWSLSFFPPSQLYSKFP